MYRLLLFGGISLEDSSGPVSGRVVQRRQLAMLSVLASSRSRNTSREKLVGLLWPERPEESARHLLADALYVIRRELGKEVILTPGDQLRLDPSAVWSDVGAFHAALARSERVSDRSPRMRALETAASLYRGPFLDGFYLPDARAFEEWMEGERRRLADRYARALEVLAEGAEAREAWSAAVDWWKRRAAHEPTNSRVAVRLIEALANAGNVAGAVRQARSHVRLLADELGLEPPAEVRVTVERLKGAGSIDPAPDPTTRRAPGRAASAARDDSGPTTSEHTPAASGPERDRTPRPAVAAALAAAAVLALLVLIPGSGAKEDEKRGRPRPLGTALTHGVAVLPFESEAGDSLGVRFATGFTEDLVTHLSRIRGLQVLARDAVQRHAAATPSRCALAELLGARALVEGSVRRDEDRIRVNVRLLEPCASTYVWARSYDRELADVFAIQGEVARNVAQALDVTLEPFEAESLVGPLTRDLRAWDYLTWARTIQMRPNGRDDLRFGEQLTRKALALDPELGQGYGLLSVFFAMRSRAAAGPTPWDGPPASGSFWDDSVRTYARRAIALAPADPWSYRGLQLLHNLKREHADALETGLRILEASPSDHAAMDEIAGTYGLAGDITRAFLWRQVAAHYDPDHARFYTQRGRIKYFLGDLEGGARWLYMARRLDPDRPLTRIQLAEVETARGRTEEARREISRLLSADPAGPPCGANSQCRILALAVAARVLLDARDYEGAKGYLHELLALEPPVEYVPSGFGEILSVRTALAFAHLGDGEVRVARSRLRESRRHALETLSRLEKRGDFGSYQAHVLARIHALLGESAPAIRWLRQSVDRGWRWGYGYQGRRDPMLRSLRGLPEFERLVDRQDRILAEKRAALERLEVLPPDSLYHALVARARLDVDRLRKATGS